MTSQAEYFKGLYGDTIDLGPCVVGKNLNLLTLRGYSTLDKLSTVSAPDVYDMTLNPTGTQRLLKPKHAQECFTYAMESMDEAPEESPRCFPEILLNVRDNDVIELYHWDDPAQLEDLSSFSAVDPEKMLLGARVRLDRLEFPKPQAGPSISRIDGNHRLSKMDDLLFEAFETEDVDLEQEEFPTVAFALLLQLDTSQEASLFRDINGEHVGMEVAHLDSIRLRITSAEDLKTDPRQRPLWIANELTQPSRAFEGKVFFGGSTTGVKQDGGVPPLRINSLRTTVDQQLKSAPLTDAAFGQKPEVVMQLIDRFWKAVAKTFPDAWADKRNYILLQSIGLGAFARFGGALIDSAVKDKEVDQEDFENYLKVVRDKVSLDRDAWKGVAGAGGQKVVADALLKAAESDEAKLKAIEEELASKPSVAEKLESADS